MKQTIRLLLAVLTLGMCSINGSAQNKKDIDCDSVRVLEWEQCSVCMGSGSCPVCKKYGKRYDGTKLTTCSECLGDGWCHHCFGKGGDHYYVWKHKSALVPLQALAASVEIDGIRYNLVSKRKMAEVAKKHLENIPAQ